MRRDLIQSMNDDLDRIEEGLLALINKDQS